MADISPLADCKNIIAISSCKGGVGKSTVAAHFALELESRGYKVGLLDVDIHGPSIPTLYNCAHQKVKVNDQNQLIPHEVNDIKLMSFGFLLGDAPAVMRGPIVAQYVQQLMHSVAWGELDYLLIDMPPGTGDVQLTITQQVRLTGAVIVTTPQTLSLVDVARGILMFEKVNVHPLGIVLNMAYYQCSDCKKKDYIFGEGSREQLEERFGVNVLGELSIDQEFNRRLSLNDGIKHCIDGLIDRLEQKGKAHIERPQVSFDDQTITLDWSDGRKWSVPNRLLRYNSMDALSVNELTGERMLKEEDIPADIQAKAVALLGNYALNVTWSDGHTAGIYPYDLIEKLANT